MVQPQEPRAGRLPTQKRFQPSANATWLWGLPETRALGRDQHAIRSFYWTNTHWWFVCKEQVSVSVWGALQGNEVSLLFIVIIKTSST